mmetsp:Transcript_15834/g.21432  ORF Transcript_15834/g.21432 Transcript_15834/m.21432 type:complete len:99 (-) Transcript_15834:332-628(-)
MAPNSKRLHLAHDVVGSLKDLDTVLLRVLADGSRRAALLQDVQELIEASLCRDTLEIERLIKVPKVEKEVGLLVTHVERRAARVRATIVVLLLALLPV